MSRSLVTGDSQDRRLGDVWSYVSATRLNTWLACPLKFKLRYIDGIKTPTSPALFVGKAVHLGLEHYYRHRQLGVTLLACDIASRFGDLWGQAADDEEMSFASVAEEDACRDQALALMRAYLGRTVILAEARPLSVEVALEAPLVDPATGADLGIPLVGVVDLVLPEARGPLIVDFKTSSRASEPLEIAHEIQLSSYAYLFRRASPASESGLEIRSLIKTKVPRIDCHRYAARTDKHFQRLFAVVRAYLDDLESKRFLYRPGLGCSMCDFRSRCLGE